MLKATQMWKFGDPVIPCSCEISHHQGWMPRHVGTRIPYSLFCVGNQGCSHPLNTVRKTTTVARTHIRPPSKAYPGPSFSRCQESVPKRNQHSSCRCSELGVIPSKDTIGDGLNRCHSISHSLSNRQCGYGSKLDHQDMDRRVWSMFPFTRIPSWGYPIFDHHSDAATRPSWTSVGFTGRAKA